MKIIKLFWKLIKGIFITYAVLFSIICTTLIIYLGISISKPFFEVKKLKTINPKETLYMSKYKMKIQKENDTLEIIQRFIPIDSIAPSLIKAVLSVEDDGFYTHPGVDIAAILRALDHNKKKNRFSHGASTISQQMAKNLFVGTEKSFKRKYHELAYTILMESILGKARILELYLNYAQWGKYIFGCEAAAQHYYKKSCKHLSFYESSRLAAILAKPEKLNPHYKKSKFINKRLRVIGNNLYRRKQIGDSTYISLTGSDSLIVQKKDTLKDSLKADSSKALPQHEIEISTNQ